MSKLACTLQRTIPQYGIHLVALALIESRSPLPTCQRTSRNRSFGQIRFFLKDTSLFTKPSFPLRDPALRVGYKDRETPQLLIPTHVCFLVAPERLIFVSFISRTARAWDRAYSSSSPFLILSSFSSISLFSFLLSPVTFPGSGLTKPSWPQYIHMQCKG